MKKHLIAWIVLAFLASAGAFAAEKNTDQRLQEFVKALGEEAQSPRAETAGRIVIVDPDKGIEELPFGSPVEKAYKVLGLPTGAVGLGETKMALVYGRNHSLIFRKNRLAAVFAENNLINGHLIEHGRTPSGISINVAPGIELGMAREKVSELLKREIADSSISYDFKYESENSDITIKFVRGMVFSYTVTHFGH